MHKYYTINFKYDNALPSTHCIFNYPYDTLYTATNGEFLMAIGLMIAGFVMLILAYISSPRVYTACGCPDDHHLPDCRQHKK